MSYYDYYQPEAYVPSSDTYIEKDASINEHIEQMRLSATKALLQRSDVIIVATVSAIYGLGDPTQYLSMVLHLSRGGPAHLTFGFGMHICLGFPLARMEGQVALPAVARRWKNIALAAPEANLEWLNSLVFRGMKALPLRVSE